MGRGDRDHADRAIVALTQNDIKRMLAYSAIANTGFMLIGVLSTNPSGFPARCSTCWSTASPRSVRSPSSVWCVTRPERPRSCRSGRPGQDVALIAGAFTILLLAFAGIPLTSGFTSKFAVFSAGIEGGATPVVIVGVFASAIAAFFYVRVIVLMFFTERAEDAPAVVVPSSLTAVAIGVTVAVTVILGVLPAIRVGLGRQGLHVHQIGCDRCHTWRSWPIPACAMVCGAGCSVEARLTEAVKSDYPFVTQTSAHLVGPAANASGP